ncbi:MAG: hypothetical protein IT449_06725 [Phycisphaerales bacterium]|nr:hypothetical protein [Phycisphaerales bacterium]
MVRLKLRDEALLMLEGRGQVLETAREATAALRAGGADGAVIGGVAVVLHGYVRTTSDVDLFVSDLDRAATALRSGGFAFRRKDRSFSRAEVPIHLVTDSTTPSPSRPFETREGIWTVALVDLINMKLRSGTERLTRAIDLADVIGLIRCRKLTAEFTKNLDKDLRSTFRKLVSAVAREAGRRS